MGVSAPYNFVPLSKHVCKAEDLGLAGPPSQDKPEPDGESGWFDITLTAHTPILVSAGADAAKVKGFYLADGKPAIPGSSIRGMIRNVLEIASFGRMALVDDQRVGVRDLSPSARLDYGSKVSEQNGKIYWPKAHAGWLRMVSGRLKLTPCEFARVDHRDCLDHISVGFRNLVESDETRTSAEAVENHFLSGKHGAVPAALKQTLWVQESDDTHDHCKIYNDPQKKDKITYLKYRRAAHEKMLAENNRGMKDGNGKAISPVGATQVEGRLVFTGMPNLHKHMEFFFLDARTGEEETVPDGVWPKFIAVHEDQEKPSPTWRWRRMVFNRGDPIPVFYLTNPKTGAIDQIGLAMMFKLGADDTVGQLIDHTSQDHRKSDLLDLPTRIFGRIGEDFKDGGINKTTEAFRTRVSFGWASVEDGTWRPGDQCEVQLQKPKVSYVPAYVRQRSFDQSDNTKIHGQYLSYMTRSNAEPNEIRGWKRYPVRTNPKVVRANGQGTSSLLQPIDEMEGNKPTFKARIRYHNLHQVELGALVWALRWGGDNDLRHALGMGRPFGWGQVAISMEPSEALSKAEATFVSKMEEWAVSVRIERGWARSDQVRRLKAMADPLVGESAGRLLWQMKLTTGGANDFLNAKADGPFLLPEYPERKLVPGNGPFPIDVEAIDSQYPNRVGRVIKIKGGYRVLQNIQNDRQQWTARVTNLRSSP